MPDLGLFSALGRRWLIEQRDKLGRGRLRGLHLAAGGRKN